MAGVRQFNTLLRKNLLLKTRRPKSTCFEMSLPLVLFLLLVWVRGMVEVDDYAPQFFKHNEIFPLTNSLVRSLMDTDSDSLIEFATGSSSGTDIFGNDDDDNSLSETANNLWREAREWAACDEEARKYIVDAMQPMLDFKWGDRTMESRFLSADPVAEGEWVRKSLEEVKTYDLPKMFSDFNNEKRKYLDSEWPKKVMNAATRVDEEIKKLRLDLDVANGPTSTRLRVEGWTDDVCAFRWPDLNFEEGSKTLNATALAKEIKAFQETLEESGIADWIRETDSSEVWKPFRNMLDEMSGDDMADMVESMMDHLKETPAQDIAEPMDRAAWILSNYLRSGKAMARLLGEDPTNEKHFDWTTVEAKTLVPNGVEFDTTMGHAVFQGLSTMQKEDIDKNKLSSEIDDAISDIKSEGASHSNSIMADLKRLLENITNRTIAEIEHDLIPQWNSSWQSDCPVDSSKIGNLVERTQSGCPFYRSLIRSLAGENSTAHVEDFHKHLSEWNLTYNSSHWAIKEFESFQDSVHPAEVSKAVCQVWGNAQGRFNTNSNSESLATSISHEIQKELKSGELWDASSIQCARRLQGDDDDDDYNLLDEIMNRKILIAPYKGETKRLMEYLFVELVLSVTTNNKNSDEDIPKFLEALLRCPLVRSLGYLGVEQFLWDRMVTFETEEALENYARDNPKDVLIALVFRSADPSTGDFAQAGLTVDYSIRAHAQLLPPTAKIMRQSRYAVFGAVGTRTNAYIDFGFTYLQEAMGRAVARLRSYRSLSGHTEVGRNIKAANHTEKARRLGMGIEQFPAPEYSIDRFIRYIQYTMPMFMIMGWIYAVSLLVKEIVYEKQEKLRDVMRIQGLKTWVYWGSWFASAMVQMSVLVLITALLLFGGKVFKHSDPSLVIVFFLIYSMATVSLAMLISSFFSRAKVAAAVGGLVYWLLYLPYSFYGRYEDTMSMSGKNAMCLLSSTSFGIGSSMIAKWEMIEEGVNWGNFRQPPPVTNSGAVPPDNFSIGSVMMMLLVDTVLYQVLAWYIEKVFPGTLGLPQPFYFPILPSYWRGVRSAPDMSTDESTTSEQKSNAVLECWEPPAVELESAVMIRKLTKVFKGGKKALKGISLDMYRGTILGLLGHNGAGKSTTMAILTGLYPPTEGDVLVNGCSVRKDSHGVRRQLGVCLQQNALYENITVEEHLYLFCCLKSVPWNQMKSAVEGLLHDTGLTPKRHAPAQALSGGMKRKLSIGIALSGGSKVVSLDEPTAGVDATSRRDIWQLLASHRSTRTILLSTHFMDEADILSDRIAIIAEGQLTAIGGSMFLKRHYANSYTLTLVVYDGASIENVTKAVCDAVPEAKYAGSRGRELSYTLPFASRYLFAKLFETLQNDQERARLGVDTYGLSAATMEEVFLQASSLHESGLGGVVRNAADLADSPPPHFRFTDDDRSTTSGSESLPRSNTPSSDEHTSETPKEGTKESLDEPPPNSPHCMTIDTVQQTPAKPKAVDDRKDAGDDILPSKPKEFYDPNSDISAAKAAALMVDGKPNFNGVTNGIQMTGSGSLLLGTRLWFQQFGALFRKRALSVRRDRRAWASQLLLPSLFVLIALVVAAILAVKVDEPELQLSTDMLIGTVSAGGSQSSLSTHVVPFGEMRDDDWDKQMSTAFSSAKGQNDELSIVQTSQVSSTFGSYLLDNTQAMKLTTYAAVSMGGMTDAPNITLWHQYKALHSVPAMTNMFNNARFKLLGFEDTQANVWAHPLPKSQVMLQEEMTGNRQVFVDLTVAITILLAMGFIPASFVVYLVHEKSSSGKHQQLLTGVSPTMYWTTSYFFDMVNFLFPALFCFLIFVIFSVEAYSGRNTIGIMLLLLAYGLCMTPCMYCLEPFFKVPSTAYVTLICLNIFTGTISVMSTAVLDMVQNDEPQLKPINEILKAVFPWILPNFNLGRGLIDIAANHYLNFAYDEFGICVHSDGVCPRSSLAWDAAGKPIFHLAIMAPVWFLLRLLIEWGFCTRNLRQRANAALHTETWEKSPDDAVNAETDRIAQSVVGSQGDDKDQLLITKLSKTFKPGSCCSRRKATPTYAVRGVNVGVPRGECFGLLGVNGAGKTTTMRMITGDATIDSGDVQVCGWSVHGSRDRARRHLGYCPQFDALPDKLNVRETLALYARIRGVHAHLIQSTVNNMIRRMCLESHERTRCEHLSGGNKRKLSTALALIGEPDVILLDEPSTGVDVGARRFLWDVIGEIRKSGHALVLTSHSMEECEVLCTRLTIMVAGQFRCLGSPTQLKGKYGGGYTLTIKALLSTESDACGCIRDFVAKNIPQATLAEESVGLLRYGLHADTKNSQEIPLASIFARLEKETKQGGELEGRVSDYTISQTSLEEVFLHFAQDTAACTTLTNGIIQPKVEIEQKAEAYALASPLPLNPSPLDESKIKGEENWTVGEEGEEAMHLGNEIHESKSGQISECRTPDGARTPEEIFAEPKEDDSHIVQM